MCQSGLPPSSGPCSEALTRDTPHPTSQVPNPNPNPDPNPNPTRSADSKTHVATMKEGDFYGSEQTATVAAASDVRIELMP